MRSAWLAAVLALASPSALAAEELRTLFHSAEERARLDRLRRGEPPQPVESAGIARKPAVTGFVRRSDGRATVWLDGRPVTLGGPAAAELADPSKVARDHTRPIEIKRSR